MFYRHWVRNQWQHTVSGEATQFYRGIRNCSLATFNSLYILRWPSNPLSVNVIFTTVQQFLDYRPMFQKFIENATSFIFWNQCCVSLWCHQRSSLQRTYAADATNENERSSSIFLACRKALQKCSEFMERSEFVIVIRSTFFEDQKLISFSGYSTSRQTNSFVKMISPQLLFIR